MATSPIRVPDLPQMPRPGIDRLRELLGASACFLEYGCGGSTRLACSLGVPTIFSVETDAAYLAAVREAHEASESRSELVGIHVDVGPTGQWGWPTGTSRLANWPDYPLRPWDVIREHRSMPDLVLIDGRFRVACGLATVLHALPGTTIMLDDYVGRESRYRLLSRYAVLTGIVGVGALFRVPDRVDLRALAVDLARAVTVLD